VQQASRRRSKTDPGDGKGRHKIDDRRWRGGQVVKID
jgi:hypothetical protein